VSHFVLALLSAAAETETRLPGELKVLTAWDDGDG
jgi:hypothetical protein